MDGVELQFTGERFVPGAGGHQIAGEHAHRYRSVRHLATNKRVLDLGCGAGYGSTLLIDCTSYIGIDISRDAIDAARRVFAGEGREFAVADVTSTELPSGSFDVIVCFEVIEHVKEPALVLAEAKRLLTPDGVLILSTPDKDAYNASRAEPNPFHPSELTRAELESLIGRHFVNHRILGQRFTAASAIFDPFAEAGPGSVFLPAAEYGTHPQPMYWIVIASSSTLPRYEASAMLLADERDLGAELMQAVALLTAYGVELEARAEALRAADEREQRARRQLADYQATIARLTG